jgi:hypothetical protein
LLLKKEDPRSYKYRNKLKGKGLVLKQDVDIKVPRTSYGQTIYNTQAKLSPWKGEKGHKQEIASLSLYLFHKYDSHSFCFPEIEF